jgi:hypothetical protein
MGTRRPRKGSRLCKRYALQRRGDTPGLRQRLRATNCYTLREVSMVVREGYNRRVIASS